MEWIKKLRIDGAGVVGVNNWITKRKCRVQTINWWWPWRRWPRGSEGGGGGVWRGVEAVKWVVKWVSSSCWWLFTSLSGWGPDRGNELGKCFPKHSLAPVEPRGTRCFGFFFLFHLSLSFLSFILLSLSLFIFNSLFCFLECTGTPGLDLFPNHLLY